MEITKHVKFPERNKFYLYTTTLAATFLTELISVQHLATRKPKF